MNRPFERPRQLFIRNHEQGAGGRPVIIDYTPVPPYIPLSVSDNITEHFGYEPGEVVGNPNFLINTVYMEDIPQFLSGLFHLFLRGYHVYEYRLLKKDRSMTRVLIELRLRNSADGAPIKITASHVGLSTLGGEAPAGGLEASSRGAKSGAMDITVDSTGRISHAGLSVQSVLGYRPEDMLGKNILEFIPPDYQISVSTVLMRMLECCRDTLYFWTGARHRDGSLKFIANECRGRFDDHGERIVTATCHDITARIPMHKPAACSQMPLPDFPSMADEPAGASTDPFDALTARERQIFYLTVEGRSSTQIGARLSISHRTVEAHRASLMKKLRVNNVSQLVRYAVCRIALHARD